MGGEGFTEKLCTSSRCQCRLRERRGGSTFCAVGTPRTNPEWQEIAWVSQWLYVLQNCLNNRYDGKGPEMGYRSPMKKTVCFAKKYGHFILIIDFQMVPLES